MKQTRHFAALVSARASRCVAALCFSTVLAPGLAMAESSRASVLVMDASGSMWAAQEGKKTRIEVAREVMDSYFQQRDAALPLAVLAYGHNRRNDCSDIEVIAPMGRHEGPKLAQRLRQLQPRGMTPLTESLRLARQQIPATAESADIILVTDGLETCQGDPCALAAEIAAEGIDIRAHVVGFGLSRADVQSLSCITKATGGQLFETHSGADLVKALQQVSEPTPRTPTEAVFDIGPDAEAGHTYRIGWRGTVGPAGSMGFVTPGENSAPSSGSFGVVGGTTVRPNNPVSRVAPQQPGPYELIIVDEGSGQVIARQAVNVLPAKNGFEKPEPVQAGKRTAFAFRGPEQLGERIVIARPGDPPASRAHDWSYALHKKGRTQLTVPKEPGEYEVRYLSANGKEVMFSERFLVTP
jgi:Mg-chelatase subunit ChlD